MASVRERLGKRQASFDIMFAHILGRVAPVVVETGCCRPGGSVEVSGCSTFIFDSLASQRDGTLFSVDIDPRHVAFSLAHVGARTTIHCGDSLAWLIGLAERGVAADLLYLDSLDVDFENPHRSALHHLFEFIAARPIIRPGGLLAVDDNIAVNGEIRGKGSYIAEYLARAGFSPLYAGYQMIWRL